MSFPKNSDKPKRGSQKVQPKGKFVNFKEKKIFH